MSGPASYTDAQLRDLHAHVSTAADGFDEMPGNFRAAVGEKRFASEGIEAVMRRLAGLRRVIVKG